MKRTLFGLVTVILALGLVISCAGPSDSIDDGLGLRATAVSGIKWNGDSDKAVAVSIDSAVSSRNNASGTKITSNAHSADYPGIYFIWDSKHKDNGYLKVEAWVFDKYESFLLTAKESNTYWDFRIEVQPGQEKTADDCYVFFIPKVFNNKNINMVFISDYVTKGVNPIDPIEVNLGFVGYYMYDGKVMSTSIHWQTLKEGDAIDWNAVDAAYAEWAAQGGLVPDRTTWLTSGYASFTFGDYASLGFDDFNIGQIEGFYKNYYVDPGYLLPSIELNLGFIGYYLYDGKVMSTSFYWQKLNAGDLIDWNAVDAAYAGWVAQGGLVPDRTTWQTSGYASFTFDDYAAIGYGDFNIGQLENFYKSYYVAPGYVLPNKAIEANLNYQAGLKQLNTDNPWFAMIDSDKINIGEPVYMDWERIRGIYEANSNRFAIGWGYNWDAITGWMVSGSGLAVKNYDGFPEYLTFTVEMLEKVLTTSTGTPYITIRPILNPNYVQTLSFTFFEHTSGGQYGYVGMSYTSGSSAAQLILLDDLLGVAANTYAYTIVNRTPWPGLNNADGVMLPVIGAMGSGRFNVLGNAGVIGQQTMPRAGIYLVEVFENSKLVKRLSITIEPTVQDREKLGL